MNVSIRTERFRDVSTITIAKAIVLLNQGAGAATETEDARRQRVATALADVGIDATIRAVPGDELEEAAHAAAKENVDAVIAAGGDGTLSTVAGALVSTDMPMGILPLGTLNHFAKDMGIPLDLAAAARVIAGGLVAATDVAAVNGRVFINNSSLGAYPRLVLERETYRSRHGWNKWMAMGAAMLNLFRRFPLCDVRLETDTGSIVRRTPFVFVGNNEYELDMLNVGTRRCLDRGELCLYIASVQSRWGLLVLFVRTCLGSLKQSRDFHSFCLSGCSIATRRHRLHVAVDGEVVTMNPPLEYAIRAQALRVIVPVDSE